MKRNTMLWIALIALLFILSVLITIILSSFKISASWAVSLSLFIFFSVLAKAIYDGWLVVAQQWDYIIEIFGSYIGEPLKPGIYVLFPWFGFVNRRCKVDMRVQIMQLYLDEKNNSQYGGGDVEFEDCSTAIEAFFYFQIIDSSKSTYETSDLYKAVEEKTDSILRTFLGLYKLEEVIKIKSNFYLEAIATLTDFCPDTALTDSDLAQLKKDILNKWGGSDFYLSLMNWGIKPISMAISDIQLTESLNKARQTILEAEKRVEAKVIEQKEAIAEKAITITKAEAKKAAFNLESEGLKQREILVGEGRAEQVRKIISAGVPKVQISKLLVKTKQWEAIEKGGNQVTIIEDGSDGASSQGAKFGAGFSTNKKSEK